MREFSTARRSFAVLSLSLLLGMGVFPVTNLCADQECPFSTSLHHTGEGMRYWYEEQGGFKDITGIPYEELDCKKCHIKSCDRCHSLQKGERCSYSVKRAREIETCLSCHTRAKNTFRIDREKGSLDVHIARGMVCADCHSSRDIHGDGTFHHSMCEYGAIKVSCADCHQSEPAEIKAHTVHKDRLDCAACHVSNSISCLNCHFDSFLRTWQREGNYLPPIQDWTLLLKYKGRVTTGTVQTLVYRSKKFIAYAPYFTHSVQREGRKCAECHGNRAVRLIEKGRSVPMAEFKGDRLSSWQGVVPLVPERLEWPFLDKSGDKWVPVEGREAPETQFICGVEPLSKEQLRKLSILPKE